MKSVRLMIKAKKMFWVGIAGLCIGALSMVAFANYFSVTIYLVSVVLIVWSIFLKMKADRITGE
ncbi:MAG: hypothetical protein UW41_C0011G0012 [Candidatus Collierbacteria bacterium GW2011_GWC2_44_18]|uniref:Uncharacterized protein n=2 Tax=Microgenomates group TaxID=1794810 RepID=A0A0G1HQE4_9BACT|nr:MAG: hypothetical protein UW16_C0023G0011 [Microgenomates group bacterium GW2011_GWC1_44_10]KKT49130.1 MAG: hypothetical protein UW41_C0011G0012 [Candidatus Collierbacteria bacterium GW2011_GWC2_44_18]